MTNGPGMPASLYLEEFGVHVLAAFGYVPFLVGSALEGTADGRPPNDVDVRLMLPDAEYAALGFGDPRYPWHSPKWIAMTLAFSALGQRITQLPIDFQIQQMTLANEKYPGQRSAIGTTMFKMGG